MKIQDIPKENRPRERFQKYGPEALSDAELFAILLRTGTKGENAIDMSNRLISEHGLDKLFECSLKELQQIKGIGPAKAMQLLAMAELGKRYAGAKNPIKKITHVKDVFNLFHERLKDQKQEQFIVLMLNNKQHIIGEQLISRGTLDAALVEPREVFRAAIKNAAARVILIHNHPSGDPNPSQEDIEITKKLREAGKLLNISVLDHVIIGKDTYWNWLDNPS